MTINESEILRFGFTRLNFWNKTFEVERLVGLASNLRILEVIGEYYYHMWVEEYDTNLEGFIDKDISIYKCKLKNGRHGWICQVNFDEVYEIKISDDIFNISSEIKYNDFGFVYVISSGLGYKIGYTKSIHNRASVFNVKLPIEWDFHKIYPCQEYKKMEKALHELFSSKRINGEWFNLNTKDLLCIERLFELNSPR